MFVHRIDGYTGAVTITAEGLPAGVTAKPLTIGPAARWGVLVLNIAPDAAAFTGPITLKATGTTPGGQSLVRDVRPASVTWGTPQPNANVPVLARLDQSLVLAVRPEKALFAVTPDLEKAVKKVNNKDEKVARASDRQAGREDPGAGEGELDRPGQAERHARRPNRWLRTRRANPITAQVPTQPTKDKPEGDDQPSM